MIISYAISVVNAVEHRGIRSILFVRRVAVYEDPLLQEGLFERFPDRDPEGFPLTYPPWHRKFNNKDSNSQGLTRWGIGLKVTTYVHEKDTTQRVSVKEVRMIRSQPILEVH